MNTVRLLAFLILSLWAMFFIWLQQNNVQEEAPRRTAEEERQEIDGSIARYTFWLAIGTAILAVSTIGLWIETRRGGLIQNENTQRAISDARESSEHQLRAYVYSGELSLIVEIGAVSVTAFVRTQIKNWGRTPAYAIRNASYLDKLPNPLPAGFQVRSPAVVASSPTMGLAPKDHFFNDAREKEFYSSPVPDESYYVVGRVEYLDAFRRTTRTTKYCMAVDIPAFIAAHKPAIQAAHIARKSVRLEGPVNFVIAPYHNDAD